MIPESFQIKVAAYQGPMMHGVHEALAKIFELLKKADNEGVDILCMPECYLQGYFSHRNDAWENSIDLNSNDFLQLCRQFSSYKTTLLLGLNERDGEDLYDTVVVIEGGQCIGRYRKAYPYHSYFKPGRDFPIFEKKGIQYGIIVCRDSTYFEPARILALKGARILFCPMCNKTDLDYHLLNHSKLLKQKSHFIARAFENHAWFVASDIIWENDGKEVAAGYASIVNPEGEEILSSNAFQEELLIQEIDIIPPKSKRIHGEEELVHILQKEQQKAFLPKILAL